MRLTLLGSARLYGYNPQYLTILHSNNPGPSFDVKESYYCHLLYYHLHSCSLCCSLTPLLASGGTELASFCFRAMALHSPPFFIQITLLPDICLTGSLLTWFKCVLRSHSVTILSFYFDWHHIFITYLLVHVFFIVSTHPCLFLVRAFFHSWLYF